MFRARRGLAREAAAVVQCRVVDGLRVRRIESVRAAPVIVFLHDSLGCIGTWRDFPDRLAAHTGLGALIYDRRGYGQSPPIGNEPRTPRYLHEEAAVLIELLRSESIERAVLFGHSDGGSIALLTAASPQAAGRIAAVITEGAHVFVEEVTLAGIRAARELLATTDLRERLRRYHGENTDSMTAAWIETWLGPEFRDWNIEDCLGQIGCPVLAIQGEADEYGTAAQVEAIVRGVGGGGARAEALMLPGVGHTPHRDAGEAVIEATTKFLARLDAREPS